MPRQPENEDGIGAPLPPVGAGILPGALGPAVSGHFADPAADAAFVNANSGLWLQRSGEDAVPTGITFTPAEVGLMVDALAAGPGRLPGSYARGLSSSPTPTSRSSPPGRRRLGCLITVHAQSPRHALDCLSRLLDRTRRPAPRATELVDVVVFARMPGAVWKVLDPAA